MQPTHLIVGRDIAALLHPRPVFLITTCDEEHRANASAVAWGTLLSHTPPLVGLSVRPKSRTHWSRRADSSSLTSWTARCEEPRSCAEHLRVGRRQAQALWSCDRRSELCGTSEACRRTRLARVLGRTTSRGGRLHLLHRTRTRRVCGRKL